MSQVGILQWQAIEFSFTKVNSRAAEDPIGLIKSKCRGKLLKDKTLTQEEDMRDWNNYFAT